MPPRWVSLIALVALSPLGVTIALTATADRQAGPAHASYRRSAAVPFPDHNPYSEAKSMLGKMLFFDPQLSGSRTISCSTCHLPSYAWSNSRSIAVGEDPKGLGLRSPTLIDVAFTERLGWDGKFPDIESVAFTAITNPANMNLAEHKLIARLTAVPAYVDAFAQAFGDGKITRPRIEAALATFERTIVAGPSPFDRWVLGDQDAISTAAQSGFQLFTGKARCSLCHNGPSFTDGSFQDIGVGKGDDIGRGRLFPTSIKLKYAFKTPSLRDVARRRPYMHNGSLATLEDVIELYDRGGVERPSRSPAIKPLSLTAEEKSDLISFLQTLSAPSPAATVPGSPQ